MYCNGIDEHYIDIACPFGKTNSTLEFCPPVKLFAMSVAVRYAEQHKHQRPRLSSYVDDIYGGIPNCVFFEAAVGLRKFMCDTGKDLTLVFNTKPHKTPMPAKRQVILGCLYDSTARVMKSSVKKVEKYLLRINEALQANTVTAQEIMALHGNLVFAAGVAPFGRPFLASLSSLVAGKKKWEVVTLTKLARLSLRVWKRMLLSNRGLSFDYILGNLPRSKYDIFVDASTSWGVGGCCGALYFMVP